MHVAVASCTAFFFMQLPGLSAGDAADNMVQVKPCPPPVFSTPESLSPPTQAQRLRSAANHAAMQRHSDMQNARKSYCLDSSPASPSKVKRNTKSQASHAAVDLHKSQEVMESAAPSADLLSPSTGSVGLTGEAISGAVQPAMDSAAMTAAAHVVTQHVIEGSCSCYCMPDRLVAIHVRSELTDDHCDM